MISTSPIGNLDSIDVVGVRLDGGLDLVISCASRLDGSEGTLRDLRTKISNYLREVSEATNPTLLESYGCAADTPISILGAHDPPVDREVIDLIEEMKKVASEVGVILRLDDRQDVQ